MGNLILNRVGFSLTKGIPPIRISKSSEQLFSLRFLSLKEKLRKHNEYHGFLNWVGVDVPDETKLYFSFLEGPAESLNLRLTEFEAKYFEPKYIRQILTNHFKSLDLIVEPYPKAVDISVYERVDNYNEEWGVFRRYDVVIKSVRREISFSIGSNHTLISNIAFSLDGLSHVRGVDPETNYIYKVENIASSTARIVANKDIREKLGVSKEPLKVNYGNIYKNLEQFYHKTLLSLSDDNLRIDGSGLKNVSPRDLWRVNMQENQMLFGKGQTDINAVTGLRDFGPFKLSSKAKENKFIFIYQNRDDANNLYQYFKNGLKHFPGIWSYVGVPATLDVDVKLKFTNENTLKREFDAFLLRSLPNETYNDYFAIVIGNFNKQDADDEESDLYYYIKEGFLAKGIPSQFISYKSIRSGSFHYFLPNISLAILAKLGGIPWRLLSKSYNELVIGFNQKVIGDKRLIGSAVFFSNEGELSAVKTYPASNSEAVLIGHLRASIQNYIQSKANPPSRLVIHYYKPHSEREKNSIDDLIYEELRLSIPFAIIEINDSKSNIDLCFDPDYNMGMPESGTYVTIGKNEYLLFNNTRYQKTPVRSITEELPVKVKIHFADTGGFSHHELISQVYEFSRLYWKGLKQKSQPATTIYSKFIADFAAHFERELPDNSVIHNTPWFL